MANVVFVTTTLFALTTTPEPTVTRPTDTPVGMLVPVKETGNSSKPTEKGKRAKEKKEMNLPEHTCVADVIPVTVGDPTDKILVAVIFPQSYKEETAGNPIETVIEAVGVPKKFPAIEKVAEVHVLNPPESVL